MITEALGSKEAKAFARKFNFYSTTVHLKTKDVLFSQSCLYAKKKIVPSVF